MGVILGQIVILKEGRVPQEMKLQLRKMDMSLVVSVCWKKFVGGAISISSGFLLGREGLRFQLGASVGPGWQDL